MKLNEAVIPHYRSEIIPVDKLKKVVALNEKYLREKPTWYKIEGKLQYFKIRNDFRLFTEQFFSMFGREIIGIDTLDYHVAYVRTKDPRLSSREEVTKCGLLSENFQKKGYNYYLVSELLNPQLSDFINYGGYTLESLLQFFKDYLTSKDYTLNEAFLIKLFIADAFTHQEDRNYHNIGFKIPKIAGVDYTKRLHPQMLIDNPKAEKSIQVDENGQIFLKGLKPTKVYDNERILGTDHKNVFTYHQGQIWCPLFPYNQDTLFATQEDAIIAAKEFDGLDPNLFTLYLNHSDICKPLFERLAYDDEYRGILERFQGGNMQINLSPDEQERITAIFEDKRQVLTRILKY